LIIVQLKRVQSDWYGKRNRRDVRFIMELSEEEKDVNKIHII
jgi:hypothetical protein